MPRPTSRRTAVLLVITVCMLAVGAAPASAAPTLDAIAVGDSVMLGARWTLRDKGIEEIDAKVSRQATTGPGLLRERGDSLPQHVVVHLGSNGTYTLDMCKELVRTAGPERTVYLVTVKVPRPWEARNNAMLATCARRFAEGRVVLVDWHGLATRRPELLYADGVHLRPDGAAAFARMIARAIREASTPGRES